MRRSARAIGLLACLLALLAACGAPPPPQISAYVATSPALGPTVLPSVTPAAAQPAGAPQEPAAPTAAALAARMEPVAVPELAAAGVAMDAHLRGLASQGRFSGAVLVAYRGQIVLSQGYGLASADPPAAATPQTRLRLASVSKPITALTVLSLAAEGRIALDESICAYLEGCPAAWQPITPHHLLNHSSGLANYTDFLSFADVERLPASVDQVIARFRDLPLGFAPGTLFQYTNSNYVLLGRIIEEASGQSYADAVAERVFGPLGMANSGYDRGDGSALNGTRGYAGAGNPAIPLDTSNLYAAGALYSTAEDLYRLSQALDAGTLLTSEWAARMQQPQLNGWGYGWKIDQRFGRRVVFHPGYMSGASTYFARFPDDGLTVIVLSNDELANAQGLGEYLAGMVFG